MRKILITGSAGKTGQTIIRAAVKADLEVYAMLLSLDDQNGLFTADNLHYIQGDFGVQADLDRALAGMDLVYHICPNMAEDEVEIGERMILAAQKNQLKCFIYHSVMHPQVSEMPHHWKKLQVEERLFKSQLKVIVIQPAAYMENLIGYLEKIKREGIYSLPYSGEAKFSNVSLTDVAEAVVTIATHPETFVGGIFELVGPEVMSNNEMMQVLGDKIGIKIQTIKEDLGQWQADAEKKNMPEYAVKTLVGMFNYYDKYGFVGNSHVLRSVIKREPTSFTEFIDRIIRQAKD